MTQQDQQSRATLREWILYMVKYPAYFHQATGFRATDANIERFACELFRGDTRTMRFRVKHYHKSKVIVGLHAIANHIGLSIRKAVGLYHKSKLPRKSKEWAVPIWKEHGEYHAYKGRLDKYARKYGLGKYAKQSISEAGAKAGLQGASTQEGLQQHVAKDQERKAKEASALRRVREAGKNH